jgi:hypothetical protein
MLVSQRRIMGSMMTKNPDTRDFASAVVVDRCARRQEALKAIALG